MQRYSYLIVILLAVAVLAACGQREDNPDSRATGNGSDTLQDSLIKGGDSLVVIETAKGKITVELFTEQSPLHAENFKKLVREGFYNGTTFHRVIPQFVIQGGDPNSRSEDRTLHGRGGPGYTVPAEIGIDHKRGYLAAARLGDQVNPRRESSGSQFYICLADLPNLDGGYTVFGRVVEGMDVVDLIAAVERDPADNPIERVEMTNVSLMPRE